MFGYYTPGERRHHTVLEGDLLMLRHAGQALLEADRARLLAPWGPMAPEARRELEIALERARKSLEERQKFG